MHARWCSRPQPLDARIEILGAPVVTLEVAADRPLANLVVRLCDVHPDGASLRVSYGILNLAHRDGHETPAPLVPRTPLSGPDPTERRRLGLSGRAHDQGGAVHDLLADDLAKPGERDGDGVRRDTRSAGSGADCRGCPAGAAARARDRRARADHGGPSRVSCGSTGWGLNWAPRASFSSHIERG